MSNKAKAQYFQPGENMTIRAQWKRQASPEYDRAVVSVPGRLHFGVLDFSKMAPGLGGGGLGISTDTANARVVVSRNSGANGCHITTGQHLLQLFKECVGYRDDDISIFLEKRIKQTHSGFGSNVSFNTAVIAGLNALFGSPFSAHEMWDMVTQNYVENTEDKKQLYFGLDTGVGEACFLYGGLVWVDASHGQGRFIRNITADNLWVITGVGDRLKLTGDVLREFGEGAALSDKTETNLVASHFMDCEKKYGATFKQFIYERMSPALLRDNIYDVLSLGWEMNEMSNMKVLEGIYRTDVLQALNNTMRSEGALYAGMSSAGPGFFAFADSEKSAYILRESLERTFGDYFSNFVVGRAGSKLTIDLQNDKHITEQVEPIQGASAA